MPEEYKIDYTGIQIPDIEAIKRTSQQFTDWRRSMGFQTEEEKNAALTAEMQAAQQRFNDQDLWNSEDPYEVYNVYETDPVKQAEFRRNGQMVAGVGSTLATLPFTAGMMGGWTPAIVSTATGAAGGHVGAYGGQKLGQYIDDKYGTNLTPGLTFAGGLIGGTITGGLGYKGWEGATNQYLINKAFKSGQLKWGQPTSYTAYHQSATPITKFKFPFKRWDVAKHGADPNGAFFTVGQPAGSGFLAERPYTGQFQVKVQKPLIQTGELTGPTKNGLRNAIVRRARKNGADAVFFDGIADNTLQNQQILFAMDNADISFTGGPGKVRYFGPTMGKTTLVKTNNNYVDLDQLVKPLRKQVAEQLGLKVSDPRVAKSPEYQTALKQIVEEFQTNTANAGKTLVGSQKQLLNGDFVLDGEPMLPDFETFVARNQARGFKETPEQLRVWYDEILGLKPDIKVDDRYVSEIVYGKPSKLTLAERMGIPKGERNQPAKPRSTRAIEYDITPEGLPTKEFLDDFQTYKKALSGEGRKVDITDMFDSPWYRERLSKQGLTEEQANQLISRLKARTGPDQIMVADGLNYIRDFSHAEEGFPIGMTPERTTHLGRHSTHPSFNGKSLIQLTTKVDPEDVILHEIGGHRSQPLVSDFAHLYGGQKMTNLGTKHYLKVGAPSDYGIQWDEVRARALTIAKQMSDAGWNPNSPEQVNVWLNKHIFTNNPTNVNQGALYYYRPRFIKAVATGLKQGGKIENPDQ